MNWVKIIVSLKDTDFIDWQSEKKDGSMIDIVNFTCMDTDGLRIETADNDAFACEIGKEDAIHLARQILVAFNCE